MEADRRIGVAMGFSSSSKNALKWSIDNVIRKGDHLILVTIQPEGNYESGEMQLWEVTGSHFIPFNDFFDPFVMKKYGIKVDAVSLDTVRAAVNKEVEVLMKIYWGDPREKLIESIECIPLSCMIVGNRGLGKIKRAIMGSVSNYVMNNCS